MSPIPNDEPVAVDAVLDLDLGVESRDAAEIIVAKVAAILRYAPMGDNHHNAAACPHCTRSQPTKETYTREQLLSDEAKAAAQEAVRLNLPPVGFAERGPDIDVAETAEGVVEAVIEAIDKGKGGDDA